MPAKKHNYQIIIDEFHDLPEDQYFTCQYKYQNISGITLDIAPKGIRISFSSGKKYTSADLLGYGKFYLVPDAAKKALLLHLIRYSEELSIRDVLVCIDGQEAFIQTSGQASSLSSSQTSEQRSGQTSGQVSGFSSNEETETGSMQTRPFIHTLIDKPLVRLFPYQEWLSAPVADSILKFTKTTQDGRIAALYALLCSKTKKYEIERFIYLWMSFNGLYGYLSRTAEDLVPLYKGKKQKLGDGEGILLLLALYGLANDRIVESDSKKIARKVIIDLEQWDGTPITRDSLEHGCHKALAQQIHSHLKKTDKNNHETNIDISTYGYLMGFFSYYFRCNMIHANKPIPLYVYENEYELKCLRIINNLLEDFLDTNLVKYFDSSYTDPDKAQPGLKQEIDQLLHSSHITIKCFKW